MVGYWLGITVDLTVVRYWYYHIVNAVFGKSFYPYPPPPIPHQQTLMLAYKYGSYRCH